MQLSSPHFENGDVIPDRFRFDEGNRQETKSGRNINPELIIKDVPKNAESLVLIMKDIDNPNHVMVHWMLWNIDPLRTKIEENKIPKEATVGLNSFKTRDYIGPNPAQGTNRIIFELFALDDKLNLEGDCEIDCLENAIDNKLLEKTELEGVCRRTGEFALE